MRLTDIKKDFKRNRTIYLMLLPVLIFFVIFKYIPMGGIIMAFEKFSPKMGIYGSEWVGLKHFKDFFASYYFFRLLKNTFLLSFYDFIFFFPAPIIFALLLNEVSNKLFKKFVQTASYLPYFVALVVICGLIVDFTSSDGFITNIIVRMGGEKTNLLGQSKLFRTIFVSSNIWQNLGFHSIIYLAALSNVNQELYQAAYIDGAGRWKQTWHVSLPGISSTIIILLILRFGSLLTVGFEKIILLYNPSTYDTADVISSFIYRKGLLEANYSYSTAVGLFNSVINFGVLLAANTLSRKYSETSLF